MDMMRNKIFACLMAMLFPLATIAQVSKEAKKEAQRIQTDNSYYWGIGTGDTQDAASRTALSELQSQIYVNVKSSAGMSIINDQTGGEVKSSAKTTVDIETSSGGVLTNTKTIILQEKPEWQVLRYVEKREVNEQFAKREDRVLEYMCDGRKNETTGRIDNALRLYYWAYCLLRSLPNADELTIRDDQFQKRHLMHYIPELMEGIFDNLKVEAGTQDESFLNLVATYKEQKVTSLDVNYSLDGGETSKMVSFKDGIAQIELPEGTSAKSVQVDYEYRQENRSSQGGQELQSMVQRHGTTDKFSHTQATVALGSKKQQKAVQQIIQEAVAEVSTASHAVQVKSSGDLNRSVQGVINAIRTKKYEQAVSFFTPEGYEMFKQLITFGQARLVGEPKVNFLESNDGRKVCRSIPMNFTFKNNHITFTEEVALTFNPEGKIESLAFTIDNDTRQAIFDSPAQWSPEVRMAIANFLENYKTAFALKRLDYIKSIFDDYAIIVTGSVTMKATGKKGDSTPQLKEDVKYTTYNKQQYMEKLEQQFKRNSFINLRFTDVGVKKITDDDDFALRIKQDYFSSNYADTGYLFLMVDMNDPAKPLIKLRTWQPHRDPDINANMPKDNPFYGLLYEGNFQ